MSGPVKPDDVGSAPSTGSELEPPVVEITESRQVNVGSMTVSRALPRRARRRVGPWCFLDHMLPATMTPENPMEVGPHPHVGLQTVTWLVSGEAVHRDSLGVEQNILPGQLNLMTAGRGVAHAEQSPIGKVEHMHGVQLWIAQPDSTRHGEPGFEHHADLPQVELESGVATVMVGDFASTSSAAMRHTEHMGIEVVLHHGASVLPLQKTFEHALVVLEGSIFVDGVVVDPHRLAYLGMHRDEVRIEAREFTRLLVIGGEPFDEPVLMWWNFVARTREEMAAATRDWERRDIRFGDVDSPLARISAPSLPW